MISKKLVIALLMWFPILTCQNNLFAPMRKKSAAVIFAEAPKVYEIKSTSAVIQLPDSTILNLKKNKKLKDYVIEIKKKYQNWKPITMTYNFSVPITVNNLEPNTTYFVRAVVATNEKIYFYPDIPYREFTTKSLMPVPNKSNTLQYIIAIAISALILIIILITPIIVVLLLIKYIFRHFFLFENVGHYELETFSTVSESVVKEDSIRDSISVEGIGPVSINDFADYVKSSFETDELKNEYKSVLQKISDSTYEDVSDNLLINYMDMYGINDNVKKAYLMANVPIQNNIYSFWNMVWDENIKYIVLIDNLHDTKKKSKNYWSEKNLHCCGISVRNNSTETYANYEYRKFVLTRREEMKYVDHLRFTSWFSNSNVLDALTFVEFFSQMAKISLNSETPVVVHGLSGIGSVGFILLCDMCLRTAEKHGIVDVCETLKKLSNFAGKIMINNFEEFRLVYLVIAETLCYIDSSIQCRGFNKDVQTLSNDSEIQKQIEYLESTKWLDKIAEELKPKHDCDYYFWVTCSEREGQIFLTRRQEKVKITTAYSFRNYNQYIITKYPPSDSLRDFWRLIAEQDISLLILLNDKETSDDSEIWSVKICKCLRPLKMMSLKYETVQNFDFYQMITLQMQYLQEFKIITILSLKNWPTTSACPLVDVSDFVKFCVKSGTFLTRSNPVLVTCFDGVKASGLYVSMMYNIGKINVEGICDVPNSVRAVRRHCSQFVSDNEQFKFLCKAVEKFIETRNTYLTEDNRFNNAYL